MFSSILLSISVTGAIIYGFGEYFCEYYYYMPSTPDYYNYFYTTPGNNNYYYTTPYYYNYYNTPSGYYNCYDSITGTVKLLITLIFQYFRNGNIIFLHIFCKRILVDSDLVFFKYIFQAVVDGFDSFYAYIYYRST